MDNSVFKFCVFIVSPSNRIFKSRSLSRVSTSNSSPRRWYRIWRARSWVGQSNKKWFVVSFGAKQLRHWGDSIKLYLKRWVFKALKPSRNLVNQMPGLFEQSLWYGLYWLVPRTKVLKIFTDWVWRMFVDRLFHRRIADGKNELNEFFSLEKRGLNSLVCLNLYVVFWLYVRNEERYPG